MLVNDTHRRLWLRCEVYTLCKNLASVCKNAFFISVYISLSFFRRIEEKVETRIFILEIKLKHFLAVVYLISVRICDCQCIVKFVLNFIREIGSIGILFIQDILNLRILSGINFKTTAVKQVGSLCLCVSFDIHQIIDDLIGQFIFKVSINCIFGTGVFFLRLLNTEINVISQSIVILFLTDIVLIQHMLKNFFSSLLVAFRIRDWIKFGRVLGDTCQSCAFGKIQIPYVFIKVLSGSCLYTIGACTEVDGVQIILKDRILACLLFNLNCKVLLLELTGKSLKLSRFAGPVGKYIVFQKLLCNGTGTFGEITCGNGFYTCTQDTFYVNTVMFIKSFVLNSDYRMLKVCRNLVQGNGQSV